MSALVVLLECVLAPFAALGVLLSFALSPKRGRLASFLSEELAERAGSLSAAARGKLAGRRVWWLHAASAGEVNGLATLVEALAARPGAPALLVTTTTRAGREAARSLPGVAWAQLAPVDAWPFVAAFLSAARPERLLLAETELWPTTLILGRRAGLRPALVNARLTERSVGRYRLIAALLRPALDSLSLIAAQSGDDAARFRALGAPEERIKVAGNSKYDRLAAPASGEAARERAAALGWTNVPVFVAGSTHPIEEELVLAAFLSARRRVPGLRLALAPRHLERAADAAALVERSGLRLARWSGAVPPDADVLLLDEMGVLASFYGVAAVAFVGGTLVPVGGHNLLEPALAGAPVLFGPHTKHVDGPAALLERSGGRRVSDAEALAAALGELAANPAAARALGAQAKGAAESLRGATGRILALLDES